MVRQLNLINGLKQWEVSASKIAIVQSLSNIRNASKGTFKNFFKYFATKLHIYVISQ